MTAFMRVASKAVTINVPTDASPTMLPHCKGGVVVLSSTGTGAAVVDVRNCLVHVLMLVSLLPSTGKPMFRLGSRVVSCTAVVGEGVMAAEKKERKRSTASIDRRFL